MFPPSSQLEVDKFPHHKSLSGAYCSQDSHPERNREPLQTNPTIIKAKGSHYFSIIWCLTKSRPSKRHVFPVEDLLQCDYIFILWVENFLMANRGNFGTLEQIFCPNYCVAISHSANQIWKKRCTYNITCAVQTIWIQRIFYLEKLYRNSIMSHVRHLVYNKVLKIAS